MDSLTHIALGACMGEAFAGKKLGKKAMLWGAIAQSLPDIDAVAVFWMDTPGSLLAHRGFTHSLLFLILVTPVLALLAERMARSEHVSRSKWFWFIGGNIFVHLFIDAFNNYGVAWFEPFSQQRVSFNTLYVADPFFSIAPIIAFIALILLKTGHRRLRFWWSFGLISSSLYLGYSTINKLAIDADVRASLKRQEIPYQRYFTTPAPLQNWLWFVVAGDDNGYHVGYRSLFDKEKNIQFQYFPRNDVLLESVADQQSVQQLIRFSEGFYSLEKWSDTLVFNDLRFGQIIGWQNPREHFAFHYFINFPEDNSLVVQRGRFAKWDWTVAKGYWARIFNAE